jgi:hypothetical protein
MNLGDEIRQVTKHIQAAEETIQRQQRLIARFEAEGLPTIAENDLLHAFYQVLAKYEAKLARLVYEQNLAHAEIPREFN